MVYKPNIPAGSDDIGTSQGEIQDNFQQLNTSFGIDHVAFNDTTDDTGKHLHTIFSNLTAKGLGIPATGAEELALYVKDDAAGDPQLFMREKSSGTEQQVSGSVINAANGEAPLFGGFSIKWGVATGVTNGAAGTAFLYIGDFGLTDFTTNTYSLLTCRSTCRPRLQVDLQDRGTSLFSSPVPAEAGTFVGYGRASPADNFRILSKKFNLLEHGEKIQLGYIDVLAERTGSGAITLKVYSDYRDDDPINGGSDTFFNTTMSTAEVSDSLTGQTKAWHRVFCPNRANMIQLEWTLSPAQVNGAELNQDVVIDAQILWVRKAGRLTQ